ncbi:hypothetical protein GCM10011395_26940 [Sphingomonas psychrolutea]|uniref:Uncharacterized protein n=1 Tax=Sphingomonas psychrolutea TaxID=1259676 RepID=A0ABQ1H1K8_9SPHN|nr:hypothetical protein GCM10011395_26940 [Sphingomonas psychrolutea]
MQARPKSFCPSGITKGTEARTVYEVKNVLNQMMPEYAKLQRRGYLKDTAQSSVNFPARKIDVSGPAKKGLTESNTAPR